MSLPEGPLINCDNKDDYDILSLLLNMVYVGSDGLLYLNVSGGATAVELLVSLTADIANPFSLTKTPSIVQFYSVDLLGVRTPLNLSYIIVGTLIIVYPGNDYTNVLICYI